MQIHFDATQEYSRIDIKDLTNVTLNAAHVFIKVLDINVMKHSIPKTILRFS